MKYTERMHNFYYPMHWREACMNIELLWCMNECRNS